MRSDLDEAAAEDAGERDHVVAAVDQQVRVAGIVDRCERSFRSNSINAVHAYEPVLTEWDEFKWLDLDKAAELMAERNIVDARNILDIGALRRRGFTYRGIGRS